MQQRQSSIINNNNDSNGNPTSPILRAITDDDADAIKGLVTASNINSLLENNRTPLFFACLLGKLAAVIALLDCGADINAESHDAKRAIHGAASGENVEIVKLLHAKGANLNELDSLSFSPLHYACWSGQLKICRYLVANGADVSRPTTGSKTTPLYLAAISGNRDIVELLIAKNAPVDAQHISGRTPLAQAILEGKVEAGLALLEAGASLLAVCGVRSIPAWAGGQTALDIAQRNARIAQLNAQEYNFPSVPAMEVIAERRKIIHEETGIAHSRCRELERRIESSTFETRIMQQRTDRFRQAIDKIVTENTALIEAQSKAEKHKKALEEHNTLQCQTIKGLLQELKISRENYQKEAKEKLQSPWQKAQNQLNQQMLQFEEDKRSWRETQCALHDAEQKLSSQHIRNFQELTQIVVARNNIRKQLYSLNCVIDAKARQMLNDLPTIIAMVKEDLAKQAPRSPTINFSEQPTLSAPITSVQLQRQREWLHNCVTALQKAADTVNINHKAMDASQHLTSLYQDLENLTVEISKERLQQEKLLPMQEPVLQLIHQLQKLKHHYKMARINLESAQKIVYEETTDIYSDDLEAAQDTLKQNKAAFVKAREAYLQALRRIRDYIHDFKELTPFVNEAPENPLLTLQDFQIESPQSECIWKATRDGMVYALKQRKKALVAREFHILKRIQHPFVMSAETLFADSDSTAVLVLPWFDGKTFDQWVTANLANYSAGYFAAFFETSRNILHSVLLGLSCVHAAGVVHGDLRMQNILVDYNNQPLLCDFDQSIDPTYACGDDSDPTPQPHDDHALEYLAPELTYQPPAPKSTASDMFAFGVCVWNANFRGKYFMRDNDPYPVVPAINNEDVVPGLRITVEWLLRRNPKERPSANATQQHAFFTAKSLTSDKFGRWNAFRRAVRNERKLAMPAEDEPRTLINLSADNLQEQVAQALWATHSMFGIRFDVQFQGEHGIDEGALTAAMYMRFLHAAFASPLFQRGPEGKYLPKATSILNDQELLTYRAIGVTFARMLIEERAVKVPCPSSFFKFLLGEARCEMTDLEEFDRLSTCNMLRLLSSDKVCELYGFEDVGEPHQDVTPQNKHSYVRKYLQWQLIGSRMAALNAIREGFRFFSQIDTLLPIITWADLRKLLSGEEVILPNMLENRLVFYGFSKESPTPELFVKVIRSLAPDELRRFVCFATSQETLPVESRIGKIRIDRVDGDVRCLPVSHACFWQIVIPEYTDEAALREKLLMAINTEAKFTIQ